jgi:tetratricopeptide (TPR) repeat protein
MKSFAGRYQDQLNGYLRDGEAALRKGEYYRAADLFDLASTVDPSNPLPLLDRGHALLAAGDYVSAATSLERGIARFPQIAAFQIDLPALGGSIYDVRRADLEKKLANSDQYRLRFLLGYLELYSGLPEEGIRDLEQAASTAPPDSIISIFADLVTNRKELPALPQLQGVGELGQ